MRKIILFIASSIDGLITGKDEDLSWLFTDADYGYKEFYAGIDTVITGRKTYDICLKIGETYADKELIIFSKTHKEDSGHFRYINSGITEFVKQLKNQSGKNIWLLGGSEIITLLENEQLIDEYVISIHPVIAGEGIPLFTGIKQMSRLKLVSSEQFSSGLVQLKYIREQKTRHH